MVYIIAVHLEGGDQHEHITHVKWQDGATVRTCSRAEMIKWIYQGNKAFVTDGVRTVEVLVVDASPPYLRTFADGRWTNNLIALPRF
jgi:hypothetical protein